MIKIKEAIIVEGKYDKNKLSQIVDTIIIATNGFAIFKNTQTKDYIKKIATEQGIIILTDSDSAGFLIRNHLKSFIDEKYIKNAYIPQQKGKEKRKTKNSKEGLLGVEGIDDKYIEDILKEVSSLDNKTNDIVFTTKDLFHLSLTGCDNSKGKKQEFLKLLNLPSYISNKELLKYMNLNTKKVVEIIAEMKNKK